MAELLPQLLFCHGRLPRLRYCLCPVGLLFVVVFTAKAYREQAARIEYYAVTDARTCLLNSTEKAKLQIVLRHIEKACKLAECRVDRYKQQLRRDLIDLEAHKMAMRSHALGFKQLQQLDDASQREMLKVVSQRGRYNYSLKSEVRFQRELMSSYNGRLEHAKKLLEASKKQSQEAMAKGDLVCNQLTRSHDLQEAEDEAYEEQGSHTPACLIFPRI